MSNKVIRVGDIIYYKGHSGECSIINYKKTNINIFVPNKVGITLKGKKSPIHNGETFKMGTFYVINNEDKEYTLNINLARISNGQSFIISEYSLYRYFCVLDSIWEKKLESVICFG